MFGIHGREWIQHILTANIDDFENQSFQGGSVSVVQRKLRLLLGIQLSLIHI